MKTEETQYRIHKTLHVRLLVPVNYVCMKSRIDTLNRFSITVCLPYLLGGVEAENIYQKKKYNS